MEIHVQTSTDVVMQFGSDLGERDGCVLVTLDANGEAAFLTALGQRDPDGDVLYNDGAFSLSAPSPALLAARADAAAKAAAQDAAYAVLRDKAASDPAFAALCLVLGVSTS